MADGESTASGCVIAQRATSMPHATGTAQRIVDGAKLDPGGRVQPQLWHGFSNQVRSDVTFQTRRIGDSGWS
jgi:hypothetical protein